jgi:hypothetical protein
MKKFPGHTNPLPPPPLPTNKPQEISLSERVTLLEKQFNDEHSQLEQLRGTLIINFGKNQGRVFQILNEDDKLMTMLYNVLQHYRSLTFQKNNQKNKPL